MAPTSEKHIESEEIFNAMFSVNFCNEEMHNILKENIGSFDLWYECMEFLRRGNEQIHAENNFSNFKPRSTMYYLNNLYHRRKPSIKSWTHHKLKKNRCKNIDILFISRDRFIEVNDGGTAYKSDYLFYSIIQEIVESYPSIKIALLCDTDPPEDMNIVGYNIFRFFHPFNLFKSLYITLKKVIQWNTIRKSNPRLRKSESNLNYPYLNINAFFSFRLFAFFLM
ncbi:MAG: hypothetical protein ACOYCB_10990, partial [Fastidiosipilaceae bacterium]